MHLEPCAHQDFTLNVLTAGPYTGAALNPARVFGPALVFDCFWDTAFLYIFGQLLGGFVAAVLVLPLYGFGQFGSLFDTRILSWLGLHVPHRFQKVFPALKLSTLSDFRTHCWPNFGTAPGFLG